jgi:hypothetical protein
MSLNNLLVTGSDQRKGLCGLRLVGAVVAAKGLN